MCVKYYWNCKECRLPTFDSYINSNIKPVFGNNAEAHNKKCNYSMGQCKMWTTALSLIQCK